MTAPGSRVRAAAAVVGWFGLFALTPGLFAFGPGSWVSGSVDVHVLVETAIAAACAVVLVVVFRRTSRRLFARHWSMWLYALPVAAASVLPFHYGLPRPLLLYLAWMTVSVFWQDYVTFGLLHSALRRVFPGWATIAAVAVLFATAHVLYLPDRFLAPVPALAMLALGAVMAALRAWTGTLHVVIALHLTFYFAFA